MTECHQTLMDYFFASFLFLLLVFLAGMIGFAFWIMYNDLKKDE